MRRFITKIDIDALLDAGETLLECGPETTITDLAVEYARSKGMTVRRVDAGAAATTQAGPGAASAAGVASEGSVVDPAERAAVRAAVVAALGSTPPNLDAVIDRAMRSQ